MAEDNKLINEISKMVNNKDRWNEVKSFFKELDSLQLGKYYCNMIATDIKHVSFTLSRYKFASKILMYKKNVSLLELGCQEALGALLFKQNIDLGHYVGIDSDEEAIQWNKTYLSSDFDFICDDFLEQNYVCVWGGGGI